MDAPGWIQDENAARQIGFGLHDVEDPENRGTIERYLKERHVNGVKDKTLVNHVHALRDLAKDLGDKPFTEATKEDLVDHFADTTRVRKWRSVGDNGEMTVTEREVTLSENTLAVRKQIVRRFYKWLHGSDDYPEAVKDIKPKRRSPDMIPTDKLISEEDLHALIKAHGHPRDKAIVAVLFESGMRAGEFVSLNVRHVEFDQYGGVITLPKDATGLKTGARRIRLIDSVSYMKDWYESHPRKDDPEAPLWISISDRSYGSQMTTSSLWYFCKRAGERAGLDKDLHPHLFRHSSATEKVRMGWNEAELRAYFGWARGSDMPAKYNHLAGRDYEERLLERRGLLDDDERKKPALSPKICPACGNENPPDIAWCQQCRSPISPEAEEQIQEQQREMVKEELAGMLREELRGAVREIREDILN